MHTAAPPRPPLLLSALVFGLAVAAPLRADDASVQWLHLDVQRPEIDSDEHQGLIARELMRQAVLLAAREDFGLMTRDAVLEERLPDAGVGLTWTTRKVRTDEGIALDFWPSDGDADQATRFVTDATVARGRLPGHQLPPLLSSAEAASREAIRKRLEAEGLERRKQRWRDSDKVPDAAQRDMKVLNELAQFHAARQLHAHIAERGLSPELVTALVRTYGKLGSLTSYHFNGASKLYYARALLYAQRYMHHDDESAHAYALRGYAWAMAGVDAFAISDLTRAREAAEQAEQELPGWAQVIDDYVHHRYEDLESSDAEYESLARYLRFLIAQRPQVRSIAHGPYDALYERQPMALRAIDEMASLGGVRNLHVQTRRGPAQFKRALRELALGHNATPRDVRELADEVAGAQWPELPIPKLVERFDAAADSGELAWTAMGEMIREIHFVQAYRRVLFQRFWLAAPAGAKALSEQVRPTLEGHRYQVVFDALALHDERDADRINALMESIAWGDLNLTMRSLLERGWWGRTPEMTDLYRDVRTRMTRGRDDQVHDLARWIDVSYLIFGHVIVQYVSPESPLGPAKTIMRDWERAEGQIEDWKEKHGHDLFFIRALADRYMDMDKWDEAQPLLERYVEATLDRWGHERLAEVQKQRGDLDGWRQTMDAYLEQGYDAGLSRARVNADMAEHLMDEGEFEEALDYALAAAGSGSAWGMRVAALVNERLGRWQEAELWRQRMARRYRGRVHEWYFWTRRTDRGQSDAAAASLRRHYEQLGDDVSDSQRERRAVFHWLEGELEEALADLRARYDELGHPEDGLYAALLALELDWRERRDELLERLVAEHPVAYHLSRRTAIELARALRDHIEHEKEPRLDLDALTEDLHTLRPRYRVLAYDLIARTLDALGRQDEAVEMWQHATEWLPRTRSAQTLALASLHERGIDPYEDWKLAEPDTEPRPDMRAMLDEAQESYYRGEFEHSRELFDRYVSLNTHHFGRRWAAGTALALGEYERARSFAKRSVEGGNRHAGRIVPFAHEGLGQWDQAEVWAHRAAERNRHYGALPYWWTVRTGHGDAEAARAIARTHLFTPDGDPRERNAIEPAIYHLIEGEHEDARELLGSLHEREDDPEAGLHLALVHNEAGNTAARNRLLRRVAEEADDPNDDKRRTMIDIADAFADATQNDADPPRLDDARAWVDDIRTDHQPEVAYLLARLFEILGEDDAAEVFWQRSSMPGAASDAHLALIHHELRQRGEDPYDLWP